MLSPYLCGVWNLSAFEESLAGLRWPELGAWEKWMKYALDGGGKRLRPALAWESYRFYQGESASWEKALPLLQAIELLHTFTLVHDDVMDRSALRRGRPTLYKQTDENTAILIGDALLIAVYQRLAQMDVPETNQLATCLSQAALRVCHGQLQDLTLAQTPTPQVSMEAYLTMITEKTGALLGAALEAGALLAQAPMSECQQLRHAGELLGRFFQLQDDYLDAFGEETGKVRGGDIAEGKKTFLWLWAWEKATPHEKSLLEDPTTPPEKRREIGLNLYDRLALRERGQAFLQAAYEEFLQALQAVQMSKILRQIGESLRHRQR